VWTDGVLGRRSVAGRTGSGVLTRAGTRCPRVRRGIIATWVVCSCLGAGWPVISLRRLVRPLLEAEFPGWVRGGGADRGRGARVRHGQRSPTTTGGRELPVFLRY